MKLIRYKNTPFFLPDINDVELKGKNIFVFTNSAFTNDVFIINDCFSYTSNFIICFYKGEIDFKAKPYLDNILDNNCIIWIDSFLESDITEASIIYLKNINHLNRIKISFEGGISLDKNNSEAFINYNPQRKSLVITNSVGQLLLTSNGAKAHCNQLEIPLTNIEKSLNGFTTKFPSNFGSILLQTNNFQDIPSQPKSPYIISKKDEEGNVYIDSIHVKYFEDNSFSDNVDLFLTLFPYRNHENDSTIISGIEYVLKNENTVKWNGINEFGNHYQINSFDSFRSILTKVDIESKSEFVFMPDEGDNGKLRLYSGNQNSKLLLGFSGTESYEKNSEFIDIVFKNSNKLKVNDAKDDLEAIVNSKSKTTYIEAIAPIYNLDAEKMPLFNTYNLIDGEVDYQPIPIISEITIPTSIPNIPTLTLIDNPELIELENVFSKIRLRELTKNIPLPVTGLLESEKKYVTPQGFLREGNTIEFVKSNGTFTVENVTLNSDFNLSLSKEDVFFVLEPSMLKSKTEKVSVNFKIGSSEFSVELKAFNTLSSEVSKDTYIIFKFSRHSFFDLLNEPSKWSNYNSYKPKDSISLIKSINEKIDFPPDNDDYKYFNDTIKNDPNWNGVVILNIPIADQMPAVFNGLAASQDTESKPIPNNDNPENKLKLKTGLKFQYVAFPVNRTKIEGGVIDIASTSFYGIIDYDILNKPDKSLSDDYPDVSKHFKKYRKGEAPADQQTDEIDTYRFLLTKLLVRFENSQIRNFKSFAFLQLPDLFENKVEFGAFALSHPDTDMPNADSKANLIRLEGNYQKNSAGNDEFNFSAQSGLKINFEDDNILKSVTISKLGFSYSKGTDEFRFDIDANADLASWSKSDFFSIEKLEFQNIGFKFKLDKIKFPTLKFDLSRLLVFPKINFDGNGFLSSFPIKFSHFQTFQFPKIKLPSGGFKLGLPNYDFFNLIDPTLPNVDTSWLSDVNNKFANLFSFVFDFDLGTLGALEALKALKGQLLIGWSFNGGFAMGFKLNGPSNQSIHLDLFGAIKLDIFKIELCQIQKQYVLKILDARLKIFNLELPSEKEEAFNAIIFATPGEKTAWLFSYIKGIDPDPKKNKLLLGVGQRVGIPNLDSILRVQDAVDEIKVIFDPKKNICPSNTLPSYYNKDRNWLIGSEAILPSDWPIELKFIFNDPVLYGIYLGFKGNLLKGFSIDILYKKLSDSLGVYSTEIQLPNRLRNQEIGGAFLKLPNIGIEIYTNGDWKVDIGFPRNGNDWSRSGFLQLRTAPPFVGFFGFYIMMSKVASLTLFKGYIDDTYSQEKLQIIQAGFAMRVGIGFYYDKGILYVGASITVYGILEGAFAFERQKGLAQLFPDHFAVLGRMGAIAELVGYVDFGIIKASVYISLRAEFGMRMVYIGNKHTKKVGGGLLEQGIQPVLVYIEGEVNVRVTIKIGCVKIRLSFRKLLRFEYTIGGGGSSGSSLMGIAPIALPAFTDVIDETEEPIKIEIKGIKEIPMMYLPAFSKVDEGEGNGLELKLIHSFMIPFFGKNVEKNEKGEVVKIIPSDKNILKDKIIKPFFDELIQQLESKGIIEPRKYETIRSVLVTGYAYINKENPITKEVRKTKVKVDISINGYVPTFIKGINSGDETLANEILKKQFLFKGDNSEHKPHDVLNNSIEGKYKEELLLIPAPISSNIKIVNSQEIDTDDKFKEELNVIGGFNVNIKGLVDREINSPIVPIEKDVATLAFIEKFYDDYKTQFLDRSKIKNEALFAEEFKDIREKVSIPEFFKLIGLLTLEAFQNDTNSNKDKKGEEECNPIIQLNENGDFLVDGRPIDEPWKTNDAIPQIVGQLNYFYNSGLRLPFKNNNYQTKSIYSILQQEETVKPIAAADLSKIKIDFNGVDLTSDVFRDDPAKNAMLSFIKDINKFDVNDVNKLKKKLITNDNDYNPTNNPIQFTKPYRLMPVSLAVQNGKLGIEGEFKFFEIPRKLSQHSGGKTRYSFEVNYAKYENDEVEFSTLRKNTRKLNGLYKCLNVEVKVRKHKEQVLEILNVFADDLNLMNALHSDNFLIENIDFYYKPDIKQDAQEKDLSLINLKKKFVTILKTNLSPRTSPPIFKEVSPQFSEELKTEYWEDSNKNTDNFIRLVWEALTTNNGGYYLILDKEFKAIDNEGKEVIEGSIIISFSSTGNKTPAYFNTLKIATKPSNNIDNKGILNNLKTSTHYLFIDTLKLSNEKVEDKLVLEYQSTIPAHTMGFEVIRNYDEAKEFKGIYSNYLPLEFSLINTNGVEVLSRDKILPIMPSSFKDKNDDIVKDKVKYSHITPLVIQSSYKDAEGNPDKVGRNLDRYIAVGQTYDLSINLRDVFGNRTNPNDEFLASANYTHQYFDKLVPIESWPLIQFSYWFKKHDITNLVFDISCTCDILEILDLAGIAKNKIINPDNPNEIKYEYKYKIGKDQFIEQDDVVKLQEVVPGILNNLYTIYAQLNDSNTVASINEVPVDEQKENWKITVKDLFEKLEKLIKNEGDKYKMPEMAVVVPKNYSVEISTAFKLKTPLKIEIGLNRLESSLISNTNKDLLQPYIWDYNLTKEVKTIVAALNLKNTDKSKLTDLNDAIRGTDKKYCLGISSEITQDRESKETKSDKVIFLINEDKLSLMQAEANPDKSFAEDSCYFGIKPIRNSLWSGNYKPVSDSLAKQSFSNVDLDNSLRIVLEKIDSFLHANNLPKEIYDETNSKLIKETYNRLLSCKKLLVNEKLIDKLAWVMNKAELSDPQKLEFRDLLLNNLTNFYAYDGMVKTKIKDIEILKYKVNIDSNDPSKIEERIHRLNVNLKSDKYNLISSKIGDKNYVNEWYILFDQKEEVNDNINFNVQPQITHIEYDIRDVEGSEDIKQSTWIQLINPITLKENYAVKDWQKITRKFPDKPVIIKHMAAQMYKDGDDEIKHWDVDKIGLWNYELEIKEHSYEINDIIHVDLEIKTATKSSFAEDQPKFEGFIAYWASEFSKSVIDNLKFPKGFIDLFKKFVEDLERQFNQPLEFMFDGNDKNTNVYPFFLTKIKDPQHENKMLWKISVPTGSPLVVKGLDGKAVTKIPNVIIGSFDIFKNENRIISILPKVKVKRNFNEKINFEFVYETDTVMPESPAIPQLQYHLPIRIIDGKNMTPIFDKIAGLNLPYKSTAKLLINTADLDNNREAMLPVIPVRQMEFNSGGKPLIKDENENEITIDKMFNKYSNGYPSISLTIYNDDNENQPPIFVASNIYKQKQ